ncbi:hypothetical protein CMU94_02290 [Elizabethkingia anophelis]|nr:hypothetical protein [Elizabethkingia anophelis]
MSNKTALQELKIQLEKEIKAIPRRSTDFEDGQEFAFNHILDMLDVKLLEKEKQQIMEAYHNGQVIVFNLLKKVFPNYEFPLTQDEVDRIEYGLDVNEDAEDYYKSKYENNGTTN